MLLLFNSNIKQNEETDHFFEEWSTEERRYYFKFDN